MLFTNTIKRLPAADKEIPLVVRNGISKIVKPDEEIKKNSIKPNEIIEKYAFKVETTIDISKEEISIGDKIKIGFMRKPPATINITGFDLESHDFIVYAQLVYVALVPYQRILAGALFDAIPVGVNLLKNE